MDWQRLDAQLTPPTAVAQGQFPRQAAVLALFTDCPKNPELIFILRAAHLSTHAGEVAFPGGMWEPGDSSLLDTALRETHEEIALDPACVQVLGARPVRRTRAGIPVTPFVGVIAPDARLQANPAELQAVFRVPLGHFQQPGRIRTDVFRVEGHTWQVPAYEYQGYEIWGFTAALTQELLHLAGGEVC